MSAGEPHARLGPLRRRSHRMPNYRRVKKASSATGLALKGATLTTKKKTEIKQAVQDAEREAILAEHETLKRLFPPTYSPDIGAFNDGKLEVMCKPTLSQAQSLPR